MCNRLYKYLLQNNILYEKQYGFQASNSTEDVVIQLISKIQDAFNENRYTLGNFLDLTKAFGTVDQGILLKKKLDMYGVKGKILKWFHSYQHSIKQSIIQNEEYLTIPLQKSITDTQQGFLEAIL